MWLTYTVDRILEQKHDGSPHTRAATKNYRHTNSTKPGIFCRTPHL